MFSKKLNKAKKDKDSEQQRKITQVLVKMYFVVFLITSVFHIQKKKEKRRARKKKKEKERKTKNRGKSREKKMKIIFP